MTRSIKQLFEAGRVNKGKPLARVLAHEKQGTVSIKFSNVDSGVYDQVFDVMDAKLNRAPADVYAEGTNEFRIDWRGEPEDIELVVNELDVVVRETLKTNGYETFTGQCPVGADFGFTVVGKHTGVVETVEYEPQDMSFEKYMDEITGRETRLVESRNVTADRILNDDSWARRYEKLHRENVHNLVRYK